MNGSPVLIVRIYLSANFVNGTDMSNVDFIKKLYNGKNCYSDHMDREQLELLHIHSSVEDIILNLIRKKKIVFLTGNPGDGKTFIIRAIEDSIKGEDVYIETDVNKVEKYETIVAGIVECFEKNKGAIIAVNEYPFYKLQREIRKASQALYDQIQLAKNTCITYDISDNRTGDVIIIDLNERNLLDDKSNIPEQILDKMCSLISQDSYINKDVEYNVKALSDAFVKSQFLALVKLAMYRYEHYAIRDILGAFSFILTACLSDGYEGRRYYDAIFESDNPLLNAIKQFDPIYLTKLSLDESLWNATSYNDTGWKFGIPDDWPSLLKYNDDPDGALNCFISLKRRFYFEHKDGADLLQLQPKEISECINFFVNCRKDQRILKQKIIRALNKLFQPSSDDKKTLYIWTTHRYDMSKDALVSISRKSIGYEDLELLLPQPSDWLKNMEYIPNHLLLRASSNHAVSLMLDVDFLRTLDAVDNGYPPALLSPEYEQKVARFLQQLDDNGMTEENDSGEVMIASRTRGDVFSVYIRDNKYSFEEDE